MTRLTNPVTGHEVTTDAKSVAFWQAAGYVGEKTKPVKKAPTKASSKSSKKSDK